ncbi:hypothetical protein [Streptomyces flaveus]|uniref:hypothetical protein n=1 Tax=Streptomyces flaveus TaxID=66370 RepID=UPI003325BF44
MSDWIAAAAGLLGAGAGAGAAMWGARQSTRAAFDQLFQQEEHEHRRWQRDQRLTAYAALLAADDRFTSDVADVMDDIDARRERGESGDFMVEGAERLTEAYREVITASSLVELVGPIPLAELALRLRETDGRLRVNAIAPESWVTEERFREYRSRYQADHKGTLMLFRMHAAQTLGFQDHQL